MPDRPLAQLTRSSRDKVSFHFFQDLSNFRNLTMSRLFAMRRMRDLVRDHDAVVARLHSEIGLLAAVAAEREGKPCCIEIVGCPRDGLWNYGGLKARFYAPLAAARLRGAARRAAHTVYVTNAFLQDRYPTQAGNILAGSDVTLRPPDRAALARKLDEIADRRLRDPVRLGMIGTLQGRSKGIQVLLRALAQARPQLPALKLRILGQGDIRAWMREATEIGVADLVQFDGTLPSQELVLKWLGDIDVYIQPSLQEGLPRALIEAMSQGCPAIASTAGGIPELLPGEDLVPPDDHRALGVLLAMRLVDTGWMKHSASRNWERAQDFDPAILNPRRDAFWREFQRRIQ
ncbi:MAG TPA: glycosyltransferase, partial [Burkholderiales bacterium]|nr:glycosyltransferase [Burkholderiales bacterium]